MKNFAIIWNDLEYSDWALEAYKNGLFAVSKTRNLQNIATLFCRKDRTLRLLLSEPYGSVQDPVESITDSPEVNLFGTDIPKENITARVEQGVVKIEFKLPDGLDPEAPKSTLYVPGKKLKGMSAMGANRFWFHHDLSDTDSSRF